MKEKKEEWYMPWVIKPESLKPKSRVMKPYVHNPSYLTAYGPSKGYQNIRFTNKDILPNRPRRLVTPSLSREYYYTVTTINNIKLIT